VALVEPWSTFVGDGFEELGTGGELPAHNIPPPRPEALQTSRSADR
jgi:hypothetical protein